MLSSELREQFSRALQAAKALKIEIRERDLIVYSRGAEPPAFISYIASLHAGLEVTVASTAEASVHILPYSERPRALIFSTSQKDSRAVSAAITASLSGSQAILIAPPQPPLLEERLEVRGVERVKLPTAAPVMTSSLLALMSAPRLMGFRDNRVREEIAALESALEWSSKGLEGLRGGYDLIAYSPTTRAGAFYYRDATGKREPVPIEALPALRDGRALALYSSAEEGEYREIMTSPRRAEAEFLSINADPVMAALYSVLYAALLAGKVI
ncbi:MAG: hypothetical protein NZ902_06005 [Acidilobaceae archaeon]|nr:hypothetical protein [Acidilobaceae archaeon]MCX8166118.1 hypothetical protein [Acidilobaceae archaeon]MDW7974761.1 hypothetical protein [Sulfolobales archaeon]